MTGIHQFFRPLFFQRFDWIEDSPWIPGQVYHMKILLTDPSLFRKLVQDWEHFRHVHSDCLDNSMGQTIIVWLHCKICFFYLILVFLHLISILLRKPILPTLDLSYLRPAMDGLRNINVDCLKDNWIKVDLFELLHLPVGKNHFLNSRVMEIALE